MAVVMDDKYVSTEEAARMLGVSPTTAWRFIQDGRLKAEPRSPFLKRKRAYRVERASVIALLENPPARDSA